MAQHIPRSPANETIARFGYPDTLLAEYDHWVVLLREPQATLGALILACKEPVTAFSEISPPAFGELQAVTGDIEGTLRSAFKYDKINYLMLMMVDPHVHFHVIPRYASPREFAGVTFADAGWPAAPNLGATTELDGPRRRELISSLQKRWPSG